MNGEQRNKECDFRNVGHEPGISLKRKIDSTNTGTANRKRRNFQTWNFGTREHWNK